MICSCLMRLCKLREVYFQNVEKFFLNTPYTTCIKTEAVNNYTKWRNQVDEYRKATNQVNTRKNPTIYKKSQDSSKKRSDKIVNLTRFFESIGPGSERLLIHYQFRKMILVLQVSP